ncbi:MAG: radical SAM protein [Nitrospirae bacterium]|nr:radical SAM protein [Nitrospirota bacterium]
MKRPFNSLAIDISDKCNLACVYCFEVVCGGDALPAVNPPALYRGIDFFLDNLASYRAGGLDFHFGRREPLMNFPLLHDVVGYIERKGEESSFRPRFHLTTNGTCFSSEVCRFLKGHGFDIRVSLDGFPQVHDKHRRFKDNRGSFDRIVSGLETLKDEGIRFTVNSVYHPGTPFHQVYELFSRIGADRVDFFPLWIHDSTADGYFAPEDILRMKKEMESLVDDLIEMSLSGTINTAPRIVQIENHLRYLCGYKPSPFYCGAGRNYLGLSGSGHFYPCLKFINLPGWVLGDCSLGIVDRNLEHYLEAAAPEISEIEVCRDCPIRGACKGLCYVDRVHIGDYGRSFSFYCSFQKGLFGAAASLYNALKTARPDAIVTLAGLADAVQDMHGV